MSLLIEGEPKPRLEVETASPVSWPVRRTKCPPISLPPLRAFDDVLHARRSSREIVRAPLRKVVNAIAFAVRPQFALPNDPLQRTRRPAPSAGALHPIDIIIADWTVHSWIFAADHFPYRDRISSCILSTRDFRTPNSRVP